MLNKTATDHISYDTEVGDFVIVDETDCILARAANYEQARHTLSYHTAYLNGEGIMSQHKLDELEDELEDEGLGEYVDSLDGAGMQDLIDRHESETGMSHEDHSDLTPTASLDIEDPNFVLKLKEHIRNWEDADAAEEYTPDLSFSKLMYILGGLDDEPEADMSDGHLLRLEIALTILKVSCADDEGYAMDSIEDRLKDIPPLVKQLIRDTKKA